ncbi:MAG: hypothetical protein Q4B39_02275 [[Ruminococcus] gnavus]|nr:hypothetical protein [Mediterraneibacter gnavus]
MKLLNTYRFVVLSNCIACLFLIGVFGSFLPTNLVELQTTADYTTAMMIVGFVMWGVWNGIKVILFVIDFCTGAEKDRMWIREMTEIGLNHQHTIRDVEMCKDKKCMYGKILLQSIYGQKPKKFRIVISGKELVEYAEKKVATVYYFKRSRIIEKIVFDESQ